MDNEVTSLVLVLMVPMGIVRYIIRVKDTLNFSKHVDLLRKCDMPMDVMEVLALVVYTCILF